VEDSIGSSTWQRGCRAAGKAVRAPSGATVESGGEGTNLKIRRAPYLEERDPRVASFMRPSSKMEYHGTQMVICVCYYDVQTDYVFAVLLQYLLPSTHTASVRLQL